MPSRVKAGRHNIARTRLDAWFRVDSRWYHGVNIGDNQILRFRPVAR